MIREFGEKIRGVNYVLRPSGYIVMTEDEAASRLTHESQRRAIPMDKLEEPLNSA